MGVDLARCWYTVDYSFNEASTTIFYINFSDIFLGFNVILALSLLSATIRF